VEPLAADNFICRFCSNFSAKDTEAPTATQAGQECERSQVREVKTRGQQRERAQQG
jgi:hypothetical protein